MKILYDHQTFYQKIGGVSRYFTELLIELRKNQCEIFLSCYFSNNLYVNKVKRVKAILPILNSHKLRMMMQTVNKILTIRLIRKNNFDIFHATQYSPYFIKYVNRKTVITIHDMISEIYNNNSLNSKNKSIVIPIADAIVAISQNTKNDILKFYPTINPNKIVVIHHGVRHLHYKSLTNYYGNYILFVGQRDGYKNFSIFFEAIKNILQNDKSINLVCTGSKFSDLELRKIKEADITLQCFSISASNEELHSLYKYAKVFVFPSLYEGFGLPILEAFSNGCPVCLSNTSCFPEIAQDAALYFDPLSASDIKKCVESVVYSENISNDLVIRGYERVKHFSWEKSAQLHFELYKSLLN